MASITLKNVTKIYEGNVMAMDDVSIDIADREFVVLVGPSGCGKSTVLRCIAGLERAGSGELFIGEQKVNDVPPRDRDIAMVFQNYALYPHMSVYKNMAFGLENRKMDKKEIDQKVREAARILGIEDLLRRKPRAMSGGQRQRVALGRAMVRDPAVFLLDEPLSNLDAKLRTSMRTEIIKLHQSLGATFVYVTHDQIEAMTMGDRIAVMDKGRIQQIDTPRNLYDRPANVFVAGFIGNPPMNFLDATIEMDEHGCLLRLPDAQLPVFRPELAAHVGKPVLIGVRPDHLRIVGQGLVSARVELVEALGGETFIHLAHRGDRLVVKTGGSSGLRMDDNVQLSFDADKVHIFDKESGKAL